MIEIQVLNLENLVPVEFIAAFTDEAMLKVLKSVIEGARDHWAELARKNFHTTMGTYIDGIQPVEWRSNEVAVISLVGLLPNLLEQGMKTTDMHDTLLGPNVPSAPVGQKGKHPRKDGGFYRAIPFRHYTPGSGAHGQTMSSIFEKLLGKEGAAQLGKDAYRAAKKLKGSLTDPYTKKTSWGERLDTANIKAAKTREKVFIPKLKPYHAVDPLQGMVKMQKKYEKKTQSSYMTFRTITDGPSSSPWIRQGTPGKHLAQEVSEYVSTRLAPMAFQAYVNSLK